MRSQELSIEQRLRKYEWPKTLLVVLILVCQTIFLSSCANPPIIVKPNTALTVPIIKPELEGDTFRDLAESYLDRGQAIDEANRRLEAIRSLK